MSERLRPIPHVVSDSPAIDFDAQTHAELLGSEGLQAHQIEKLTVCFYNGIMPKGIIKRFFKEKARYDPFRRKISIGLFPESIESKLNFRLLHETKHAIDCTLSRVKDKSKIRDQMEEFAIMIGIFAMGLIGLSQVPIIKNSDFFAFLSASILLLGSAEVTGTVHYRFSTEERHAQRFAKKMMKDPQFNSLVTFKK